MANSNETAKSAIRTRKPFLPRTLARSEMGMSRLADRWAPEGIGALRQPALRSLGFVDRLLVPQRTFAETPVAGRARAAEAGRTAAPGKGPGWWMFPVPWFSEAQQSAGAARTRPQIRAQAARDADVAMGRRPVPPPPRPEPLATSVTPAVMPLVAPASVETRSAPTAAPAQPRAQAPSSPVAARPEPPVAAPSAATAAAPVPAPRVEGEPGGGAASALPPAPSATPDTTRLYTAPAPTLDPVSNVVPAAPVTPAPVAAETAVSSPAAARGAAAPAAAAAPPMPAVVGTTPAIRATASGASAAGATAAPIVPGPESRFEPTATPLPSRAGLSVGLGRDLAPEQIASLRAWTPLVSAPAAEAAELLLARHGGEVERRLEPETESLLRALVAPSEPAAAPAARPATPIAAARPAAVPPRAPVAPAAPAAGTTLPLPTVAPATPVATAVTEARTAPVAGSTEVPAPSPVAAASTPPAAAPVPAPGATAPAATAPAVSEAAFSTEAAEAAEAAAGITPAAPLSFTGTAGPRVHLPAGLDGLFAGMGAAGLVARAREGIAPSAAPEPRDVGPSPFQHIAWADAWLARVTGSGAAPASTEPSVIGASTATPAARAAAATAAPSPVFVSPTETVDAPQVAGAARPAPTTARPTAPAPVPALPTVTAGLAAGLQAAPAATKAATLTSAATPTPGATVTTPAATAAAIAAAAAAPIGASSPVAGPAAIPGAPPAIPGATTDSPIAAAAPALTTLAPDAGPPVAPASATTPAPTSARAATPAVTPARAPIAPVSPASPEAAASPLAADPARPTTAVVAPTLGTGAAPASLAAAAPVAGPTASPFVSPPAGALAGPTTAVQPPASFSPFTAFSPEGPGLSPSLSLAAGPALAAGLASSPVLAAMTATAGLTAETAPITGVDVSGPALTHVAWADAWLARFAGTTGAPAAALAPTVRALGPAAAPSPVFVSPDAGSPEPATTMAGPAPARAPSDRLPAAAPRATERAALAAATPASIPTAAPAEVSTAHAVAQTAPGAAAAPPTVAAATAPATDVFTAVAPAARPSAPRGTDVTPTAPAATPAARSTMVPAPLSFGLPSALAASPIAPALADLLGFSAPLTGSGSLVERLTAAARPAAGGAARPVTPQLIFPQLAAPAVPGAAPSTQTAAARPAARPAAATTVAATTPAGSTQTGPAPLGIAPSADPGAPAPAVSAMTAPSIETAPELADEIPASPITPTSMRPGSLGAKAETFAVIERLRSAGLALDFITPELYAAARSYGFNGADAARAAHLAEAGYPVLAALAAGADRALMSMAAGPTGEAPRTSARAAAAPGLTLSAPSAATPTATPRRTAGVSASDSATLVPGASPRGAFLLPKVARDLLAQRSPGTAAFSVLPTELAALDVMAAGAVAGVDGSTEAPVGAARTAYQGDMPVPTSWGATDGRELAPAVRAARAMALAAAGNQAGIVTGRAPYQLGGFVAPSVAAAAAASFGGPAGAMPMTDIVPKEIGWALQALVAPTVAAITPANAVSSSFVGRPAATPAFIRPTTAPSAQGAAAPSTAELVRTGAESRGGVGNGFEIPDWFEAAARKMLADKGGSDESFGLPELTLIGAAAQSSTTRLAAKTDESPSSLKASASAGGGGGDDKGKDDLEEMAREIFEKISVLHEVAKLRSGD